jgi:cobalt-zinc-cadmium efflux system outer membrane protein
VLRQLLLLSVLFLLSGCTWAVRQETDQSVRDLVDHPFDIAPQPATEAAKPPSGAHTTESTSSSARSGEKEKKAPVPEVATDVQTTAWMESPKDPARGELPLRDDNVQTVAWAGQQPGPSSLEARERLARQKKLDLNISPRLPGSEAPRIVLPTERGAVEREIQRIYPELPPLPVEPQVRPGPDGKPYALADLQRLAAANSPTLRQAASDVEAAKGNLIQAKTYPNPTIQYLVDPANNNSTTSVQGGAIDQPIITGGKMKLGVAAAQRDLDNAILALKRARSDLSTAVRNAYFTVLVDVETLVVTRALVQFSDDIYRLQTGLLSGTQAAPYEPTALRAQTYANRLAYKQAIASYIFDWKALVATLGLPQLPLSEISGRVDRFIPYYDYDEVRAHVLQHHTDILTARNVVRKSQFLLKVQQQIPIFPNLDIRYSLEKDFTLAPFGTYQTVTLGLPLPIWDQNKGNIIAAQAALLRASEESHRVEVTLTNSLALAYEGYKNNLYAMEYYRRYILPDLVRYYRGVFARRQVDQSSPFGDLVFAQQNLSTNVTSYIGILGSLWSSVVSVADFLQTDDLFQLAKPRELPDLPDFNQLPHWACSHDALGASCTNCAGVSGAATAASSAALPPSGPAGRVPVGPAGSETGPPPPQAGAGGAPPPPFQGVQPPAAPRPANPTDRPPAPPSGSEGDATGWLDRRGAPDTGPVSPVKSYFGKEENRGDQAFTSPMALVQSYFGKVRNQFGQAFLGPAAPVKSYFGEEQNHEGQNY